MGRSAKKGPFVDPRVYEKVEKQLASGNRDASSSSGGTCGQRAGPPRVRWASGCSAAGATTRTNRPSSAHGLSSISTPSIA